MASHSHEQPMNTTKYIGIWLILVVLLFATVWVAQMDLSKSTHIHSINILIAMCVAFVKMTLVVLFFMHVKFSSKLTWIFTVMGFFFLIIMFGITMGDYQTRPMEKTQGWAVLGR